MIQEFQKYNDPFFAFWKAFGYYKEASIAEAISELSGIQMRREIQYATLIALEHFHQESRAIDRESLKQLKDEIYESRRLANTKSKLLAASFYTFTGQFGKADDEISEIREETADKLVAKGWLDYYIGTESSLVSFV